VLLCVAAALGTLVAATPPRVRATYEAEIASAVLSVEEVHAVPPVLVMAVIAVESSWNPRAISRAGAVGLMQVMPATAAKVGVRRQELFVPERNILAGTRLLAVLLRHYRGDLVSALVAYNAGARRPNAPVPQNGETPTYVWRVLRHVEHFASAARSPAPLAR
jgi:soluble lytic murein transglycosylase-like protein